jgi:tetratricopeptide (TPR) repeat protein
MLTIAVELDTTNNVYMMHDLGKSYNMNAFRYGHEGNNEAMLENLRIAAGIFEKAIKIDDKIGILFHALAVSRFYLNEPEIALKNINKAIELNEQVPTEFITAVKEAIK